MFLNGSAYFICPCPSFRGVWERASAFSTSVVGHGLCVPPRLIWGKFHKQVQMLGSLNNSKTAGHCNSERSASGLMWSSKRQGWAMLLLPNLPFSQSLYTLMSYLLHWFSFSFSIHLAFSSFCNLAHAFSSACTTFYPVFWWWNSIPLSGSVLENFLWSLSWFPGHN